MPTREERIEGDLIGLPVGGALGVPYEFHAPGGIPPAREIEFVPPLEFLRAPASVPPGTWSDDRAQVLCLLASLLDCGRFNASDFAARLLRWHDEGYRAVDSEVFDGGIQPGRAFQRLRVAPVHSGRSPPPRCVAHAPPLAMSRRRPQLLPID
jgi:ADP-ribosyl-[dinitrogen reductase] hydrolase